MKRLFLLMMSMAVALSASVARDAGVQNYIAVNGVAEIRVEPNVFYLEIVLEESALRGKMSLDDAHKQMVAALRGCGVEVEEKLRLSDLSSAAKRRNEAQTTVTYELLLNSTKMLVESLSALEKVGISRVAVTKSDHDDIEKYRDEARIVAVQSARNRAAALGEALGQSVGDCYQIVDNSYYSDRVMMAATMSSNDGAADMGGLRYNDIIIRYNVNARFVLGVSKASESAIIK